MKRHTTKPQGDLYPSGVKRPCRSHKNMEDFPAAFDRPTANSAAVGAWVGLISMLFMSGCGYSHTVMFPPHVRTVAVPIFDNQSFYQGLEFDLTEALIKEIELQTPYKVTSASRADTILQGQIVAVRQTRLSRRNTGGVPQELEMRITANFEWKDLHTGHMLRRRDGFQAVGRYIPAQPVAESLQVGQHEAVQRLVRQIVSVMATDW